MVIFQSTDGSPGYHQCEGIEDAVKFVEELRNDRGVDRARIFRMEEVEFEFRPYWFVVQRDLAAAAPAAPSSGAMPPPAPSSMVAEPGAMTGVEPSTIAPSTTEPSTTEPTTAGDEVSGDPEPEAPVAPVDPFAPPPPPPSRGLFGR